jgi:3-ketoacyl-CoA thiolase (EC 2.3.1.16)
MEVEEREPVIIDAIRTPIGKCHPLGCYGARITTTLFHEFKRRNTEFALATMCIGVGQGIATLFQKA